MGIGLDLYRLFYRHSCGTWGRPGHPREQVHRFYPIGAKERPRPDSDRRHQRCQLVPRARHGWEASARRSLHRQGGLSLSGSNPNAVSPAASPQGLLAPPPKRGPGVRRLNKVPLACGAGVIVAAAVGYTYHWRASQQAASAAAETEREPKPANALSLDTSTRRDRSQSPPPPSRRRTPLPQPGAVVAQSTPRLSSPVLAGAGAPGLPGTPLAGLAGWNALEAPQVPPIDVNGQQSKQAFLAQPGGKRCGSDSIDFWLWR